MICQSSNEVEVVWFASPNTSDKGHIMATGCMWSRPNTSDIGHIIYTLLVVQYVEQCFTAAQYTVGLSLWSNLFSTFIVLFCEYGPIFSNC